VIYEEGDVGDRFYIIVSGKVGLFYNKSSQKRLELSRIGRGTYFGEASLIRDELRRETARAISHCVILSITRKKFQEFLSCNQEFEVEFQVKMAKHQVELESFLLHPKGVELLREYCKSQFNDENLEFLLAVNDFEKKASELIFSAKKHDNVDEKIWEMFTAIVDKFVAIDGPSTINVSGMIRTPILNTRNMKFKDVVVTRHPFEEKESANSNSIPEDQEFIIGENVLTPKVFDNIRREIYLMTNQHIFLRFKSSPQFQTFLRGNEMHTRLSVTSLRLSVSDQDTQSMHL
jgi:hypothetical protein